MAKREASHRGPYAVRSNDPVVEASDERSLRELRRTLARAVELFTYPVVMGILRDIDRESSRVQASNERHDEAERLFPLWIAVEVIRRASDPPLTAKDACKRLVNKHHGFAEVAPGILTLGLSARVKSQIRTPATIYREHKRAEQLRNSDEVLNAIWQDQLADCTGRSRPSAAWRPPWFLLPWSGLRRGKSDEK
jgi:hypothetical protein